MGLEHVKEDLAKRERKIDLEKIPEEQADLIAQQIGTKIGNEVKELCERARKLLAIYGLDIKLGYHLFKLGEQPELLKQPEPKEAVAVEKPKAKKSPKMPRVPIKSQPLAKEDKPKKKRSTSKSSGQS